MIHWFKALIAGTAITFLAACGGSDDHPGEETPATPPPTIAGLAQQQGLSALVAAATKANLVGTLDSADANLTVFAPSNAAFDALAQRLGLADGTALVNALPAAALESILRYHVLPARQTAAELAAAPATRATLYSFEGRPSTITLNTTAGVRITDAVLTQASVATADVAASNGIVHVIDKVLVPPGVLNIVQMAQANPDFSTLVAAVGSAGLANALSGAGPLTVFAPTNQAFADIASTVSALTPAQLQTVLTYHVLGARVLAADIPFGAPVTTLANQAITVENGPLRIIDSTGAASPIAATDIRASNGVIHVITRVLIPAL